MRKKPIKVLFSTNVKKTLHATIGVIGNFNQAHFRLIKIQHDGKSWAGLFEAGLR